MLLNKNTLVHRKKRRTPAGRSGFTVVEVVVMVSVIGILASIVIIGLSNWRMMSARNEVRSDLSNLAASMESARNFGGGYPTSLPATFKNSPTVTVTYKSGNTTTYCVDGASVAITSIKYRIDSSQGKDPIEGQCP